MQRTGMPKHPQPENSSGIDKPRTQDSLNTVPSLVPAATQKTPSAQIFVHLVGLAKTIAVDLKLLSDGGTDVLLAHIKKVAQLGPGLQQLRLLHNGKQLQPGSCVSGVVKPCDTLRLLTSSAGLLGGAMINTTNKIGIEEDKQLLNEDSKLFQAQTATFSPNQPDNGEMTAAEEKKLRKLCRVKCEENELFLRVLNYDEDDSKGSEWWNFFHKQCNVKDLQKIMALDIKNGYNVNDLRDKCNYFNNLPMRQQIELIKTSGESSQNQEEEFLEELKRKVKLALAANLSSDHAQFQQDAMQTEMTSNEGSEKASATVDLETFYHKIAPLPKPMTDQRIAWEEARQRAVLPAYEIEKLELESKKSYDRFQMNRLLSKTTLKTLAENKIFASEEIETLYLNVSGSLALILDDILFVEESELSQEEHQKIYDKIMYIFMPDKAEGKYATTTQDTLNNLSFLKKSPNALANFENKLVDLEFLEFEFEKWNLVLSSPELSEKMTHILKQFSKKTQRSFYKQLANIMLRYDQTQEGPGFNPELLAILEQDLFKEVSVKEQLALDLSGQRKYAHKIWTSNYPILCYLALDSNKNAKKLVMRHMADNKAKQSVFMLAENEHFISFVDMESGEHDASISVLIYCAKRSSNAPAPIATLDTVSEALDGEHTIEEEEKVQQPLMTMKKKISIQTSTSSSTLDNQERIIVRRFVYEMPFKKKEFENKQHWKTFNEKERDFLIDGHPKLNKLLLVDKSKVVNEACRHPVKVVWIERKASADNKFHGLLIQIDDNVFLYDKANKELTKMVREIYLRVKLEMIQGQSGDFYYAVRDQKQLTGDSLMCLSVSCKDDALDAQKVKILAPYTGQILALEYDPFDKQDYEPESDFDKRDYDDHLHIIDGRFNLFNLCVSYETSIKSRSSLSDHENIVKALENYARDAEFFKMSITDRCLSIKGKNYSVQTGYEWDYQFEGLVEDSVYKKTNVLFLENLPFSSLQIALTDDPVDEGHNMSIEFKPNPSSRLLMMLDVRRKDVLMGHMISEERVLFKLKGSHGKDYWTLMNDRGYIVEMPKEMEKLLDKPDWISLRISKIKTKGIREKKIINVRKDDVEIEGVQEDNDADKYAFKHPIMIVVSNYNEEDFYSTSLAEYEAKPTTQHEPVDLTKSTFVPTKLDQRTSTVFGNDKLEVATLVIDPQCTKVFKQKTIDFKALETEFFTGKTMKTLHDYHIRPKFIIKPDGKLLFVYASPEWTNHYIHTEAVCKDENDESQINIKLDILKLNKIYLKHFQGRDRGILIEDILHFKGPGNTLLRIGQSSEDKKQELLRLGNLNEMYKTMDYYEVVDQETIKIPFGKQGILTKVSPFYRCSNADIRQMKEKKNQLYYPELLQLSYPKQAYTVALEDIKTMNHEEEGSIKSFHGTDLLCDPENYVETGLQLSKRDTCSYNIDEQAEEVNIWTHIAEQTSRQNYYVFQNWWWTSAKKTCLRRYSFVGFYRKFCEADLQELIRLKQQTRKKRTILGIEGSALFSSFHNKSIFEIFFREINVLEEIIEWQQQEEQEMQQQYDDTQNELEHTQMVRIYYKLMKTDIIRSKNEKKIQEKLMQSQSSKMKKKKTTLRKCVEFKRCLRNLARDEGNDKQFTQQHNCNSLIYRSLYSTNTKSRDLILEIASHCQNFSLSDVFISQNEVEKILQQPTPQVISAFDNILKETGYTKQIKTLQMSDMQRIMTFRDQRTKINQDSCQEHLDDIMHQKIIMDDDKLVIACKVRSMGLRWMRRNKGNFLTLVLKINKSKNSAILQTTFVNAIFEEYWEFYQIQILYTQFVPYVIFLIAMVQFMVFSIRDRDWLDQYVVWTHMFYYVMVGFISVLYLHLLKSESMQLREGTCRNYLKFWNFLDMLYLSLSFIFMVLIVLRDHDMIEESDEFGQALILIAALNSFILVVKLIDWLRLFEPTAVFINLTIETIKGIGYFMIIMFVWYIAFGTAFYFINIPRGEDPIVDEFEHEKDVSVVPKVYRFWVLDTLVSQYELSLGDWRTEDMKNGEDLPDGSHHYYQLMFTLFIAASFLLHIVFLNMLIAIMSDVFDKVTEKRQLRKRETELSKISDYVTLIEADEDTENMNDEIEDHLTRHFYQFFQLLWDCCCVSKNDGEKNQKQADKNKEEKVSKKIRKDILYVVQTENSSLFGGTDEWEGKIAAIETFINRAMSSSTQTLAHKMNKIQDKNTQAQAKFSLHEREIKSSMGRLEGRLEEMQISMTQSLAQIMNKKN